MSRVRREFFLLIAIALWGASFALSKPILTKMGVFSFMTIRFLIGGGTILIILLFAKKFTINKATLKGGISTGSLLFCSLALQIYGLSLTSVSKNAFIVGSSVIFVPIILTLVRKQKQSLIIWLSTAGATIGLALLTLDGAQGGINYGDLISLIGSILVSFYILLVESYVKEADATSMTSIQLVTIGLLALIVSLIYESWRISFTPSEYVNLGILTFGSTTIAYLIAITSQKFIPAAKTALYYVLQPVFGAALGYLFFDEIIGNQMLFGMTLIVISTIAPNIIKDPGHRSLHPVSKHVEK